MHLSIDRTLVDIPRTGYTHAGIFHSDEVFCTALLRILNPDFRVVRGFTPERANVDIVYDIGGGMFDHHTEPRECRENGTPYASFGKLWREYGKCFLQEEDWSLFDRNFVEKIDRHDNGVSRSQLAEVVSAMNPCWDEMTETEEAFDFAVDFAESVLRRMLMAQQSHERSASIAESAIKTDGPIARTTRFAPIMNRLSTSNKVFYLYFSNRNQWTAQVVPIPDDPRRTPKVPFPKEWWGSTTNLPEGVTFCHPNGFLLAGPDEEPIKKLLLELAGE